MRLALGTAVVGIAMYVAFLITVDVPMYFDRWQADLTNGKQMLGLVAGLHDVSTRWAVTHEFARWKGEIPWMSLYFSAAVWSSLALCGFALMAQRWPRFSKNPAPSRAGVPGRASLAS